MIHRESNTTNDSSQKNNQEEPSYASMKVPNALKGKNYMTYKVQRSIELF